MSDTNVEAPPSLLTCKPEELFQWLHDSRFSKDAVAAKAFLNKAASTSCPQFVSPEKPTDAPILPMYSVSSISPRAKFDVSFYENLILAQNSKQGATFRLEKGNVKDIIIFPKPEDCQRENTFDICLLTVKEPIPFKNKKLEQVCLQLPSSGPIFSDSIQNEDIAGMDHSDQWAHVLAQCTGVDKVIRSVHPLGINSTNSWRYQFSSHQDAQLYSTTDGLPFVKCYQGVHDGALFPLEQGLLFFKPPMFVPRSDLTTIACGRGGDASSRYVDLVIQTTSDKEYQFTNIHRDELTVINEYIHQTLIPAMQKDNSDGDTTGQTDVVPESPEKKSNEDRRRVPKRKASTEALATNKRVVQQSQDENDDEDESDGMYAEDETDASSSSEEDESVAEEQDEGEIVMDEETESEEE